MIRFSHSRTVAESLREYGRGITGGPMFSNPQSGSLPPQGFLSPRGSKPPAHLPTSAWRPGRPPFPATASRSPTPFSTTANPPPPTSRSAPSSGKTGLSASPASPWTSSPPAGNAPAASASQAADYPRRPSPASSALPSRRLISARIHTAHFFHQRMRSRYLKAAARAVQ